MIKETFLMLLIGLVSLTAFSNERVLNSNEQDVILRMRTLRAQINLFDAQKELMQINFPYLAAVGTSLNSNANEILKILGPGLPEHQMGISGAAQLGSEIAELASKEDVLALNKANLVRNNCATCHASENPPGGVNWDQLFQYDWSSIVVGCNSADKNPYLCRSMNGLLSAYGYLLASKEAHIEDFEMTGQVANELVRILVDIKTKNFNHLPEDIRSKAEKDSRELASLAQDRNPSVFEKAPGVIKACQECHSKVSYSSQFSQLKSGTLGWKR